MRLLRVAKTAEGGAVHLYNLIPSASMPAGIGWQNFSKHHLLTAYPYRRAKPTGQKKPTPEQVTEWVV